MRDVFHFQKTKSSRCRSAGELSPQFKSIEIVGLECGGEHPANLLQALRSFQCLRCASDSQVVYENLSLLHCSLGNPAYFPKFQIPEMLHADPNSHTQNGEHQTQSATRRPQ